MRAILAFIGIGRVARLDRMRDKARRRTRLSYAMAAGYFPGEYRRHYIPPGEGIGRVRLVCFGRRMPGTLKEYRASIPAVVESFSNIY